LNAIITFIKTPSPTSSKLSAYIYKIEHNKKEQKRAFLKITSGQLKVRSFVEVNV